MSIMRVNSTAKNTVLAASCISLSLLIAGAGIRPAYVDAAELSAAQTVSEELSTAVLPDKDYTYNVDYIKIWRLYNKHSGEHFYTGNSGERNSLIKAGWSYEGIGWFAPKTSDTPVYRLYNPNSGDHHYTADIGEKGHLTTIGWRDEGVCWYSDDKGAVPLYRQYNPNCRGAGSHNYTYGLGENNSLVAAGWKGEGISWYGMYESVEDLYRKTSPSASKFSPTDEFDFQYILRYPDSSVATWMAHQTREIVEDNINRVYDQSRRTSFWKEYSAVGFDLNNLKNTCYFDCSATCSAIAKSAGYIFNIKSLQGISESSSSSSMVSNFKSHGFQVIPFSWDRSVWQEGDFIVAPGQHAEIVIAWYGNLY